MKRDEIKAGALLSYLNLLIGNLIPFIYTPIMLRMLGQAEYGIYGIAQSVMGYIGLLNFGIGGSIIRYLSKYRAEGDLDGEQRVFGLFIKIYSVIGAAVLIVGTFCSFHLGAYGRSLTPDELVLLERLVRLMTLNTAVFMPFNVFSSMILAHEKFIFSKTISLITSVVSPCLNLVLLFLGFGSIGLVLSATALNFVTYAIYTVYVIRRIGIRPSFQRVGGGLLIEIIRFSLFVFLANIVDILFWSTDKLIIGWAIGSVAAAIYNVGATFNSYVTSLSTAINGVLMPRVTNMAVKDTPPSEFTALFIKVGRLQFLLISFIVSAFVAFGRQFIAIWAGTGYEEAYYVALLVMIPVTVPLIQNTGLNILYAMNRHRFRSLVYLGIAILNVGLTFWWVEKYGIIGAAMATCVAYVIGNILIINWYYYKKIGIDIPLFWKNILHMCPVMLVMGAAGWLVLDHIRIDNWFVFFALAAVYTVIYWVLAYLFMMNDYEKAFIKAPISKICARLRGRNHGR